MSAAGGLAGALLHGRANNPILGLVFGGLLVFAGSMGLTGLAERLRFRGAAAWAAGAVSGAFGGLVGNQGGIRSAAMLGLDVPREAFVATATAIALLVDAARMPVYLITEAPHLWQLWPLILAATTGVVLGTIAGEKLLRRIPQRVFQQVVGAIVLALGLWTLVRHGAS
jgi:uncharacterized membrane protein YfcA